ncbi:MAG: histidine phosphatase family protein, partial [Pseudomonadota bacterium]|nr:histidine phosphatase family protein [Pseudomonadota bacterium]
EKFDVNDCTTQRNLNDAGRDQARRIGAALRSHGLTFDKVYSSEWWRGPQTAALLDISPVTPLPALNSFFENRSNEPQQTAYMREFLAKNASQQKLFLVTHQVNIWALAGHGTDSGEIIIVKPNQDGEMTYLGSILIPAD